MDVEMQLFIPNLSNPELQTSIGQTPKPLKFIDLFAGLGGFHLSLKRLGHECVFASEILPELRSIYKRNHGLEPAGDITTILPENIPPHDILCAGFPCQPFSKAGAQEGFKHPIWGGLFENVLEPPKGLDFPKIIQQTRLWKIKQLHS
jgi:hypothetical protein